MKDKNGRPIKVGDWVWHKTHGLCQVVGIEEKKPSRPRRRNILQQRASILQNIIHQPPALN